MNNEQLRQKFLMDENFISQMVFKIKNPETRIDFFKTISNVGNHWQENPTPLTIIHKMLNKTTLQSKKILVLFNIEFLQVLVDDHKVNPENIYFIADNKLEYLSGLKIFKVQSYKLDDYTVPALKKLIAGINMNFDLVFSNPPYNNYDDLKILSAVNEFFSECVVIHLSLIHI
jgi:hypothetical protein